MSDFLEISAPSKINLFLALTGKREDGFNELISVISKLELCDSLQLRRVEDPDVLRVICAQYPGLETQKNLVIRALDAWKKKSGEDMGLEIILDKQIPLEAGLGGGSSDAVAALLGVNSLASDPLNDEKMLSIASDIGSDCPVFLKQGICLVEGRGERVSPLSWPGECSQEVLLFRPPLGHPTGQIYQIFETTGKYSYPAEVMKKINRWQGGEITLDQFIANDLEQAVFSKYLYFSPLFKEISKKFGVHSMLSGSGSACFSLLPAGFTEEGNLREMIIQYWGEEVWFYKSRLIS